VRDPAATLFSNRKMWSAMFRHYALRDFKEIDLDGFLGKAFCYAADCLANATSTLGKDRLVVVDFDHFTRSPVEIIEAVNQRLSLGEWTEMENRVIKAAEHRSKYEGDIYSGLQVTTGQATAVDNLDINQQRALLSHGL
jgi:hypothetical protein